MLFFVCLLIMAVFISGVTITAARARRRAEQASLLSVLSISIDRKFPVADELQALAEGTRARRRRELFQLANLLRTGHPLDTALATVPQLVTPEALLAIQTGSETGLLPQAIRDESRRESESGRLRQPLLDTIEGGLVYAMAVGFVMISIVSFLCISIIPKFKKIFDDFGMALPDVTNSAINLADSMLSVIAPLPAILLICLTIFVWRTFFSHLGWRTFDFLPIVRTWFRRSDTPLVLRACARQVEANQPVSDVLESLSVHHWRRSTSLWLKNAYEATLEGSECWPELVAAKFLTESEAQVLMAAERTGNLPWSLRAIADAMERRRTARYLTFRQLVRPIIVLPMGLLVLFVMVALFMPLVSLINSIS